MNITNLSCWVLSDGKAGHLAQELGLAESIGFENIRLITLAPRKPKHWRAVFDPKYHFAELPSPPWPDVLITAGGQLSAVSRWVKHINPHTFTIHILRPHFTISPNSFDVLTAPLHDNLPPRANTICTLGAINRITPQALHAAQEKWQAQFAHLPAPRLAVLIGGATKGFTFTEKEAQQCVADTVQFAQKAKASLLVSTSRRTGEKQTAAIKNALTAANIPHYFYDGTGENPYLAFLALADGVITTADSISMASEAASSGKPLYLWGIEKIARGKFKRFFAALMAQKRAIPLGDTLLPAPPHPLADTQLVAGFVRAKLIKAGKTDKFCA